MSDPLKPCPYCSCILSEYEGIPFVTDGPNEGNGPWWVECHACGMTGPNSSSAEEATSDWNKRRRHNWTQDSSERLQELEHLAEVVGSTPIPDLTKEILVAFYTSQKGQEMVREQAEATKQIVRKLNAGE